ncbi:MAG: NAD-dependent epimerase/dehydratase family protein, partial [Hydrogenophaga sp.]|nr:NAD-dependent epimerase/dehydratase family protein [Hydrogenophaga sp.]
MNTVAEKAPAARRVLVTGADGFLGRGLVEALARDAYIQHLVAVDVREVPPERHLPRVVYVTQDVRSASLADTVALHGIDTVVHLASIVTPGKG